MTEDRDVYVCDLNQRSRLNNDY